MKEITEEQVKVIQDQIVPDNTTLKVVKTDTVVMEYFPLPVTRLTFDFLFRFKAPVETVWQTGSISHVFTLVADLNFIDRMEEFALLELRKMVVGDKKLEDIPEEAHWLLEITKAKTIEMKMIPLEDSNETE